MEKEKISFKDFDSIDNAPDKQSAHTVKDPELPTLKGPPDISKTHYVTITKKEADEWKDTRKPVPKTITSPDGLAAIVISNMQLAFDVTVAVYWARYYPYQIAPEDLNFTAEFMKYWDRYYIKVDVFRGAFSNTNPVPPDEAFMSCTLGVWQKFELQNPYCFFVLPAYKPAYINNTDFKTKFDAITRGNGELIATRRQWCSCSNQLPNCSSPMFYKTQWADSYTDTKRSCTWKNVVSYLPRLFIWYTPVNP